MYNIRSGIIRWQKRNFLFDGNSNVFPIVHRLRDILKTRKNAKIDIGNEGHGQVEERTCDIQLAIFESI